MKKTFKTLVTLLLVVSMTFGILSTAAFAVGENTGSQENGSSEGSAVSGSAVNGWCDVSYDENGITVVITPNASELLGTNAEEIKAVLQTLINAVKEIVISDLKDSILGTGGNSESGEPSVASVDVEEGTTVNNIWEKACSGYIKNKYGNTDSSSYVQFIKDITADSTNEVIDSFIDYVCGMLRTAVVAGMIDIDDLPEASSVESKITNIFEQEIDKRIEEEANKYVDLYMQWLTDETVVIDGNIKDLINAQVTAYVREKVNAYIGNSFSATADADRVDTVIADYMNAEIKTQIDKWIKNYANGKKTENPDDINGFIETEISAWVEEIANAYGTGSTPDNPLYQIVSGEIDGIIDEKVDTYVDDYLNGRSIDAGIESAIEAILAEKAPTVIYEKYWEYKDGNNSVLADADSIWCTVHNAIRDAWVEKAAEQIVESGGDYITEEAARQQAEEAYDERTSVQLRNGELDNQAIAQIASQISTFTYAEWKTVWDELSESERQQVVAKVKDSQAFKDKVSGFITEHWASDTERVKAVKYLVESDGYENVLEDLISRVKENADYKTVIESKVDEYLTDVIGTLRTVIEGLGEEDLAAIKAAVKGQVGEKIENSRDDVFQATLGVTESELMTKINGVYIPRLLTKYTATVEELREEGEDAEIDFVDLLTHIQKLKIDGKELFANGTLDVEVLKTLFFELPTFADIAEMSNREMRLSYDIVIETDFGDTEFTVTAILTDGYNAVRKYAAIVAEHLVFEMNEDGVIVFSLRIPAKFASLVLRAANSSRVPETLKKKLFAAFDATGEDCYALLNDVTFDELVALLDYVDFDGLLDSSFVSSFERLDGLTAEDIKNKVREYEGYYNKLVSLIKSLYNKLPDRLKNVSVMDVYDGEGTFAHSGVHSVSIEGVLEKISPKYAAIVASFMSVSSLDLTVDLSVKLEKINGIEYIIEGKTHRRGLLPEGADVAYFALKNEYEGFPIVAWKDAEGNIYTEMPDRDITLYAVIDRTGGAVATLPSAVTKTYDGETVELRVSLTYGTLPDGTAASYQWFKDGVAITGATVASYNVKNVADSGEYYCHVILKNGDKTVGIVDSNTCTVTISKADLDLNKYTWKNDPLVYDGTAKSVYLVDAEGNRLTLGVKYVINEQFTNTAVDSGAYVARAIPDTDNFNVTGSVTDYEWVISKAVYDMSGISFNNVTVAYDGKAHSIEITGTLPEGVTVRYSGRDFVNAGTYTVTASFEGNQNYEEIPDMTAVLRILGFKNEHSITDTDGVIIIEILSANGILETYKLNFRDITSQYNYLESEEIFGKGNVGYVRGVYDIHFTENGTVQPVTDEFTVRLLLPVSLRMSTADFKIVYVAENGKLQDMNATRSGNYLVFNTTHFSIYAIVETGAAPTEKSGTDLTWLWILLSVIAVLAIVAVIIIIVRKKRKGGNEPQAPVASDAPNEPQTEPEEAPEEITVEESDAEETLVAEAPVEEAPVEETPVEEAPVEEAPVEEAPVEEAPVEEAPVEEAPVEEAPVEEAPVEEAPVEEAPVEEAPVEEAPVEEAPVEEAPVEEAPVEEAPVEEAPVEEAPVEEAPVEEAPVEEAPVEEAPVEEAPVEEAPVEEAPVEEAPVEEAPVEEAPVEEAPVEEAPVEEAPVEEAPVLTANVPVDAVQVRYRTSFMSRLIQAEEPLQDYYSVVKNALLSYKGVKARTSWNFESFNKGRIQCAKLNIKGSAFQVYLGLDPKEYNANKYHFVDVGDKPKLDKVPMLLKVKSERGLKYALELIAEMMNKLGIEKVDTPTVDYHLPYETTEALAARDLVKVILPAGVTLEGGESIVKVDVGALIDSANAEKDERTASEEVETAVVEEAPVEEAPVEEAPVEEAPVEEAPVEEAPVEETPVEEAPVEEAPVEEAPVEEAPVEEAPVEEAPVEETPVEEPIQTDAVHADEIISDEEAKAKIEIVSKAPYEKTKSTKLCEINLDTICENFEDGEVVNLAALKAKRLVSANAGRVKILARGIMTKKLTVYADKFSLQAVKMITLAGGHADQYK